MKLNEIDPNNCGLIDDEALGDIMSILGKYEHDYPKQAEKIKQLKYKIEFTMGVADMDDCPNCGCTEMLCGHGSDKGCSSEN